MAKDGFVDFFKINCPSLNIPAPVTLAGTSLDDVYEYFAANVNLRRNPANPDISRKIMSASRNFKKNSAGRSKGKYLVLIIVIAII